MRRIACCAAWCNRSGVNEKGAWDVGAVKAIGLMSGTSLDGVDVALIETDGERIGAFGPTGYRPYSDDERALLRQALAEGAALTDRARAAGRAGGSRGLRHPCPCRDGRGLSRSRTHRQSRRRDCRLSWPDRAAPAGSAADGADRRRRSAGARGSDCRWPMIFAPPMSPPAGRARRWCRCSIRRWRAILTRPHPIAVLNVGGVANVTFVDGGDPIACDTGPGNALIDDFMRARTGAPLDNDGDQAATGRVDEDFIARVLDGSVLRTSRRSRSTAMLLRSPISACRISPCRMARRLCRR